MTKVPPYRGAGDRCPGRLRRQRRPRGPDGRDPDGPRGAGRPAALGDHGAGRADRRRAAHPDLRPGAGPHAHCCRGAAGGASPLDHPVARPGRGASWLLDVVLHPDGGASRLHLAAPGDVVEAIGPRGKVHLVEDARVHHFLGDQSFLPAAFVLAEAVRRPARAAVTLTVPGPDDRLPLDAPACAEGPVWVEAQGDDAATGLALLAASGLGAHVDGEVAYVGGEMTLASTIRSALVRDRGWPREAVLPKPYWRRGHGERPARRARPGLAAGALLDQLVELAVRRDEVGVPVPVVAAAGRPPRRRRRAARRPRCRGRPRAGPRSARSRRRPPARRRPRSRSRPAA